MRSGSRDLRPEELVDLMARGRRDADEAARSDRTDDNDLAAAGEEQRLDEREQCTRVAARAQARELAVTLRLIGSEPRGERAPCAEEQRLDRGLRQVHLLRDLAVRQPLPLAQQQCAP